ncbi:unnamed protein product [Dicrocoelium dendriticum]|nr:unnamed protein product [Dicrocoelium dendriticum]
MARRESALSRGTQLGASLDSRSPGSPSNRPPGPSSARSTIRTAPRKRPSGTPARPRRPRPPADDPSLPRPDRAHGDTTVRPPPRTRHRSGPHEGTRNALDTPPSAPRAGAGTPQPNSEHARTRPRRRAPASRCPPPGPGTLAAPVVRRPDGTRVTAADSPEFARLRARPLLPGRGPRPPAANAHDPPNEARRARPRRLPNTLPRAPARDRPPAAGGLGSPRAPADGARSPLTLRRGPRDPGPREPTEGAARPATEDAVRDPAGRPRTAPGPRPACAPRRRRAAEAARSPGVARADPPGRRPPRDGRPAAPPVRTARPRPACRGHASPRRGERRAAPRLYRIAGSRSPHREPPPRTCAPLAQQHAPTPPKEKPRAENFARRVRDGSVRSPVCARRVRGELGPPARPRRGRTLKPPPRAAATEPRGPPAGSRPAPAVPTRAPRRPPRTARRTRYERSDRGLARPPGIREPRPAPPHPRPGA